MTNYHITCPCKRGYLHLLWLDKDRVPIAFSINKGYLLISGECDHCRSSIIFTVTLADLLTEEPPNWSSATIRRQK